MRRFIATVLGLGISAGVAAMIMLQRWVAEGDDTELARRAPPSAAGSARKWVERVLKMAKGL